MNDFVTSAMSWIESHTEGTTPRAGFARMCEDAGRWGVNLNKVQLEKLYNSATKQSAYKATAGIGCHMAEQLRAAVETIDRNISKTPKTLAELMGCHVEESAWTGTSTIMMPNGGCWADKSVLAGYLRDMIADAAERGCVKRETVSSCGIVICYRYSL